MALSYQLDQVRLLLRRRKRREKRSKNSERDDNWKTCKKV
jgi:hypothetical protein